MNQSQRSDSELIKMLGQSPAEALSQLYDRHAASVYRAALFTVDDQETAEMLTLEAFEALWQTADHRAIAADQIRAWLLDFIRRQGRSHIPIHPNGNSFRIPLIERTADSGSGMARQTPTATLQAALNRLPDEQKQTLALAYFGGYQQREIAALLDLPLAQVETRLKQAMMSLRRALEQNEVPKR